MDFRQRYGYHFIGRGRNSVYHAPHYITNLMATQRNRNMETFVNDVDRNDYQGMEQFISPSTWNHRDLLHNIARDANEAMVTTTRQASSSTKPA